MEGELVGIVNEFFARPMVAGIMLNGPLKVNDRIQIKGHTTELEILVDSMQINRSPVQQAFAGDSVGIKVPERVRKGDHVYKISS